MSTDLGELQGALDVETGSALGALDLIKLLKAGVEAFNGEACRAFAVTGTTLDREATAVEKRALVLFATVAYLNQQAVAASEVAVVHSNVAGRTDLSGVEFAISKRRNEVRIQLDRVLDRLTSTGIHGEVVAQELGETLDLAGTLPWQQPLT